MVSWFLKFFLSGKIVFFEKFCKLAPCFHLHWIIYPIWIEFFKNGWSQCQVCKTTFRSEFCSFHNFYWFQTTHIFCFFCLCCNVSQTICRLLQQAKTKFIVLLLQRTHYCSERKTTPMACRIDPLSNSILWTADELWYDKPLVWSERLQ